MVPSADGSPEPQINGLTSVVAYSYVNLGIQRDSREVKIISQNGTTSHKNPAGQPEANMPDSIGNLTDDMVKPPDGTPRDTSQYGAIYGSWGANSGYKWSQDFNGSEEYITAATSGTSSGVLGSTVTPPFKVTYSYSGASSTFVVSHITLAVKDGVDGSTGSADYYINFHNEYENLNQISDTHVTGTPVRVTPIISSGPMGGTFSSPITVPVSFTPTCDLSGAAGQFVANEYDVYDLGTNYISATPRDAPSFIMPVNEYCWIEDTPFWHNNTGTIDNYEAQGFQGMLNFSLNRAYTSQSPLIDYNEGLETSTSAPTY